MSWARSADRQIAAMRRDWPSLVPRMDPGRHVLWAGPIRSFARPYRVRIELPLAREIGHRNRVRGAPRVTVTDPMLHRRIADPAASIPHIYRNERDPDLPFLCLYDPEGAEWDDSSNVSETIVPWAIEWLCCYEIWHLEGVWVGGGRHPGPANDSRAPK